MAVGNPMGHTVGYHLVGMEIKSTKVPTKWLLQHQISESAEIWSMWNAAAFIA